MEHHLVQHDQLNLRCSLSADIVQSDFLVKVISLPDSPVVDVMERKIREIQLTFLAQLDRDLLNRAFWTYVDAGK